MPSSDDTRATSAGGPFQASLAPVFGERTSPESQSVGSCGEPASATVSESDNRRHAVTPRRVDWQAMVGQAFGRLTVRAVVPPTTECDRTQFLCRCACGSERVVRADVLRSGQSRSCGCYMREVAAGLSRARAKHNAIGTPEYVTWLGIVQRCTSPRCRHYPNYGGRGITICSEWRHDFAAFLAHVGPRPSPRHSVDRIDNDRGYEPGNVRWATRTEQNRNKRNNRLVTLYGETKCVAAWAEDPRCAVSADLLQARLRNGVPPEMALTLPVNDPRCRRRRRDWTGGRSRPPTRGDIARLHAAGFLELPCGRRWRDPSTGEHLFAHEALARAASDVAHARADARAAHARPAEAP